MGLIPGVMLRIQLNPVVLLPPTLWMIQEQQMLVMKLTIVVHRRIRQQVMFKYLCCQVAQQCQY